MYLLGLDLGGTKTSVSLGDETGSIRCSRRIPTRPAEGPGVWLERARALMDETLAEAGVTPGQLGAAGLSVPGPMSVSRGMLLAPPNMIGWRDVPVLDPVARHLSCPVFIQNDANAVALAEARFGACRGAAHLVYLTMSTGIGAGVICNGKLVQGASDLGGEIGHHVLDSQGPVCPCGQRGCFEVYCGGLNVAHRIRERLAAGSVSEMLALAEGDPARIDFRTLVAARRMGDALAVEFWTEFIERLAQGVGTAIMLYNPEALLLGTLAIALGPELLDPLRLALPRYCWSLSLKACRRIESSTLGPQAGDIGALAVALEGLETSVRRPGVET
ncbi:MAG: ROK family protein [Kiritimatiellia bacterium]|nr:ROK family protein [Kiritimatiellia bacterium]